MPDLVIPEAYRPALQRFADLGAGPMSRLARELQSEPLDVRLPSLATALAALMPEVSSDDLKVILDALLVLNGVRAFVSLGVPEFATAVCDARELKVPSEDREVFIDSLTRILGAEYVNVTSKAMNVLTEYERTLHDARVMTDIRPVFGEDAARGPVAATIAHTLRLTYHERQRLQDFYIGLDTGDVKTLLEVLKRAEIKAASLRSFLSTTSLPHIETETE